MDLFPERFRKAHDAVQLSMSEAARVAGVSLRQLRYWEEKGFIKTNQEKKNKSHQIDIHALMRIVGIKGLLDEGYTLQAAVERQDRRVEKFRSIYRFISERLLTIVDRDDGSVELNLGPLDNQPDQVVIATVRPGHPAKLCLRKRESTSVNK